MQKGQSIGEAVKFGILAAIIAVAMPEFAMAAGGEDVNGVLHSVAKDQLVVLPWILSVVCYIGGAFMLVSGALSLKKHAENPASEPMGKGIARLVTGGAITSVPALAGIIQRSVGVNGASTSTFQTFQANFGG